MHDAWLLSHYNPLCLQPWLYFWWTLYLLRPDLCTFYKSCYFHIRELRWCIRPYLDFKTASTTATSTVHSKLDYYNSVSVFQTINLTGSNRSRTLLLMLLLRLHCHILLPFSNLSTTLSTTNALNINFLSPTKFLQPVNLAILTIGSLFNPLAVPAPHLLSPFLAHQPSPHWKSQIAHSDMHHPVSGINSDSFRQPGQSCLDSPPHSFVSSSLSPPPLSSSITLSLQAQNLPFQVQDPSHLRLLPVSFLLHVKYTLSYRIRIVMC